ncbi:MAG: hypothetical protein CMJ34_08080 [Phycisphaerae bacterium]|nr:hypothetical protein [Phycisphaerae bacterium]
MVLCLLIVSILPARWLTPWSGRIGELASLPLVPLGDGFTAIRVWLEGGGGREDPRTAEVWKKEAGIYRQKAHAAQNEVRRLQQELNILRRFPVETETETSPPSLVSASVVAIDPSPGGEHLVRINKGLNLGIRQGGVALHDQDILVGYVLDEPGRTTATIRPMHSRETRPIKAVIPVPGEDPAATTPTEPLLLQPDGNGWTATVPKEYAVQKGWEVRLSDEDWPRWAQGCLLGRVETVERAESNPNWNELRIQPSNPIHRLRRILVVSESDEPATPPPTEGGAP